MQWTLVTALTTVFIAMYIAEIDTKKTKARVPSLLVVSVIFLAGYWSGLFPRDILDTAMVNSMRQVMLLFVLINIGTMFDIQQIKSEWKDSYCYFGRRSGHCSDRDAHRKRRIRKRYGSGRCAASDRRRNGYDHHE